MDRSQTRHMGKTSPKMRLETPVLKKTVGKATNRSPNKPKYRVQSVARAAEILFVIARNEEGASRKEITDQTKLSAQTTYHLLHTLGQLGLVSRSNSGNYLLGLRVSSLAEGFRRQIAEAHHISKILRTIARKTGESVYAVKWADGEIVAFEVARGRNPIQVAEFALGISENAHARAGGKLLLALASDQVRNDYISRHPLRRCTPNTMHTRTKFDKQLEEIRKQGYAFEQEEFHLGLSCIAVPLDAGISQIAIGISAPTERIDANLSSYLEAMDKSVTAYGNADD